MKGPSRAFLFVSQNNLWLLREVNCLSTMEIIDYIFAKGYELLFMAILVIEAVHIFILSPMRESQRERELDRMIFGTEEKEKPKKPKKS